MFSTLPIVGLKIHHLSFQESIQQVCTWGLNHQHGFVCFANVHMTIEAYKDPAFKRDLNNALLVLPDGKPVALACNWLYKKKQERIAGMDFLPAILQQSKKVNAKIFLYGSTEEVLKKLIKKIESDYPDLIVAGAISPPFRQMSEAENQRHINEINNSGAHMVLVALGCPKQEKWMANHHQQINAILLGLGGAFPVMAGTQRRSPMWMQKAGLEWLYRLLQEPRRLFKRYLYTNTLFIFLLMKEFLKKSRNA